MTKEEYDIKKKERDRVLLVREKPYINAWISICSIMMFFVSFFMAYIMKGNDIGVTFVKSVVILVVSNVIARILALIWQVIIPKDQWLLMVHGRPEVDSRSERKIKEANRLLELEEEEARLLAEKAMANERSSEEMVLSTTSLNGT